MTAPKTPALTSADATAATDVADDADERAHVRPGRQTIRPLSISEFVTGESSGARPPRTVVERPHGTR